MVSLHLRSFLTASLCSALPCWSSRHLVSLLYTGQGLVGSSRSQVWLILAAVGGIAPPLVIPHRLPVLHCATLSLAHPNCDRLCSILRRWVVSLHLWSFLTASLCLAPLIHAERFWTVPNPAKLRSALFCTSGRYRSAFGLSSLAPCAKLHLTKHSRAHPCHA